MIFELDPVAFRALDANIQTDLIAWMTKHGHSDKTVHSLVVAWDGVTIMRTIPHGKKKYPYQLVTVNDVPPHLDRFSLLPGEAERPDDKIVERLEAGAR